MNSYVGKQMPHEEQHRQHRVGWLRASVLGANDGIISISSLIIGVASANADHKAILVAGVAGLVAGAISMAAGEYVSVCSQADTEESDLLLEQASLDENYEDELIELAEIYIERGVEPSLAEAVATQMMAHDALAAHARDDIGISESASARPLQAAFSSALSFTLGAVLPLSIVFFANAQNIIWMVALFALVLLACLGALSSYLSGAKLYKGIIRVTFWGSIAMVVTALVGEVAAW